MENNNILIAEFMGYKLVSCNNGRAWEYTLSKKAIDDVFNLHGMLLRKENNYMKYDTDWNWLMLVVDKIETIKGFDMLELQTHSETGYSFTFYFDTDDYAQQRRIYGESKLEATYYAVVQFIKWHNKEIVTVQN